MIISPDTTRENRIPPGQHQVDDWPILHHGKVIDVDITKWTFDIFGTVREPVTLDYEKFMSLPKVKVFSDIHCVTTWTKLDNTWTGISTSSIRELAEVDSDAAYVMVHAAGGFTANLDLDEFFAEDVLFAYEHDGELLSPAHGYPIRLIVPRLYFWKSAKWVTGMEFMERNRPGFWESNGYHMHGDPWKEERYSDRSYMLQP